MCVECNSKPVKCVLHILFDCNVKRIFSPNSLRVSQETTIGLLREIYQEFLDGWSRSIGQRERSWRRRISLKYLKVFTRTSGIWKTRSLCNNMILAERRLEVQLACTFRKYCIRCRRLFQNIFDNYNFYWFSNVVRVNSCTIVEINNNIN